MGDVTLDVSEGAAFSFLQVIFFKSGCLFIQNKNRTIWTVVEGAAGPKLVMNLELMPAVLL